VVHRRPLGNGRRLAVVGSILVIAGCLLPWYVLGGDGGLPQQVYRAFDGTGIVSFLAALATLALVVLPYAAGPRPVAIDRGRSYWVLAVAALAGVALWLPTVLDAPEGLLPDRAYGWWIAAVGAILMARAAFEVSQQPARRP
jgi:hypothetical protein